MHVNNLGVLLIVQCERCRKTRQFNAGLQSLRIVLDEYLIEQDSVERALTALGWRHTPHNGGHWLCGEACFKEFHAS